MPGPYANSKNNTSPPSAAIFNFEIPILVVAPDNDVVAEGADDVPVDFGAGPVVDAPVVNDPVLDATVLDPLVVALLGRIEFDT
jgi:hypothetical protein